MDDNTFRYQSYMVRISPSRSSQGWRATLYHAQSGERHSFGSLESLFAFIAESVVLHDDTPDQSCTQGSHAPKGGAPFPDTQ